MATLLPKLTRQEKRPPPARTKTMKFRHIEILKERCRNCGMCIGECPENAIFRMGDRCMIDRNKCNDCGECIPVCPVHAIKEKLSLRSFMGCKDSNPEKKGKGFV